MWLAGVTGYWLIWDARAQALTEAFNRIATATGAGSAFVVRSIVGPHAGGGSGVMLAIWFAHVGLTVAIGYFTGDTCVAAVCRGCRRGTGALRMIVALVIAGIALPVGMLDPADFSVAAVDAADPSLCSSSRRCCRCSVVGARRPGCGPRRRCARAEALRPRHAGRGHRRRCVHRLRPVRDRLPVPGAVPGGGRGSRRGSIAVVDAAACVGCGICVGSCSFGAMELPGSRPPKRSIPRHAVVIACQRHVHQSGIDVNETPVVLAPWRRPVTSPRSSRCRAPAWCTRRPRWRAMNHGATEYTSWAALLATVPTASATCSSMSASNPNVRRTCRQVRRCRQGRLRQPA
ncbi:MAG: hypothetical protein R2710_17190 [Acidimicrobiales bacterium]